MTLIFIVLEVSTNFTRGKQFFQIVRKPSIHDMVWPKNGNKINCMWIGTFDVTLAYISYIDLVSDTVHGCLYCLSTHLWNMIHTTGIAIKSGAQFLKKGSYHMQLTYSKITSVVMKNKAFEDELWLKICQAYCKGKNVTLILCTPWSQTGGVHV